jgi:hypothetical protein
VGTEKDVLGDGGSTAPSSPPSSTQPGTRRASSPAPTPAAKPPSTPASASGYHPDKQKVLVSQATDQDQLGEPNVSEGGLEPPCSALVRTLSAHALILQSSGRASGVCIRARNWRSAVPCAGHRGRLYRRRPSPRRITTLAAGTRSLEESGSPSASWTRRRRGADRGSSVGFFESDAQPPADPAEGSAAPTRAQGTGTAPASRSAGRRDSHEPRYEDRFGSCSARRALCRPVVSAGSHAPIKLLRVSAGIGPNTAQA